MDLSSTAPYFIAEIGINHNGDKEQAFQLIDAAAMAGVNAVKFQKRTLEKLYTKELLDNPNSQEWSFQYLLPQLQNLELSFEDYEKLKHHAKAKGLDFIVTPFDLDSLTFVKALGVDAIKMASADLVYWPLIDEAIQTRKPLILSTGMWDESTIEKTIEHVKNQTDNFVVLHCQSTYPAPEDNLHIRYIQRLQELWPHVGYSSHDRGILPSLLAYSQGARVIEKHITLDATQLGPDHKASIEPTQFKQLVEEIKRAEIILGKKSKVVNQAEMLNKEVFAKSAYLKKDYRKNELIKLEDINFMSPGKGLFAHEIQSYLLRPLMIDKPASSLLTAQDFEESISIKEWPKFGFNREWGVKCRFHDFEDYDSVSSACVEFHCSDKDLDNHKLISNPNKSLIIHAPEILDKELLDLCTMDLGLQNRSLLALERTIKMTEKMQQGFSQKSKPKVVVHLGGMTLHDENVNITQMMHQTENVLSKLDLSNVSLLPENLPPRPWYLGGQWFQHAFCDAKEMLQFCRLLGLGMTLDICHAQLWCRYAGLKLMDYVKTVMPVVQHIHLSDAKGIDGEGIQIGEGEIDFDEIMRYLEKYTFSWVPEICNEMGIRYRKSR